MTALHRELLTGARPGRRCHWAVLVLAFVFLPALGAGAHATMIETVPSDGAALDQMPPEVTVTFDEPVSFSVAPIRIFDSSGQRVDQGDAGFGDSEDTLSVPLPADAGDGTYVVTWQAVSLDSHIVSGAFVFQVGDGDDAADQSVVEEIVGGQGAAPFRIAGNLARWVTYVGSLVAVGAAVFRALIPVESKGRLSRLIRLAALIGVLGSLLQVPLLAAESTGLGFQAWGNLEALGAAAASPVGIAAGVRIAGLGVLAWAVGSDVRIGVWLGAGTAVLAELLSGHTLTADPQTVMQVADALHVAGAAVWFGGLVALVVVFAAGEPAANQARAVGRFSTLAGWALVPLLVAGLVMAWIEVRSWSALVSTGYGWTLLAKVAVVVLVLAVAAYNNRVLVPAVAAGNGGEARSRLYTTVRTEAIGLVVVLAVTGFLVNQQPAAEAAGVLGPYSTYVDFGDGQLNLVVDPNAVGVNQVHAYSLGATGAPDAAEGEAVMEFRLPTEDIGPIRRQPLSVGPGHWVHTGPELALPGTWEITFRLGSGFEEKAATAEVVVNR